MQPLVHVWFLTADEVNSPAFADLLDARQNQSCTVISLVIRPEKEKKTHLFKDVIAETAG